MKITNVTYSKTYNLGNYQSQKFELSAEIDPSVCAAAALIGLQAIAEARNGNAEGAKRLLDAAEECQDFYAAPSGWEREDAQELRRKLVNQAGL